MTSLKSKKTSIAVLGGGSWGTALVKILVDNGHEVHWYIRNIDVIESIKREGRNPNYLSQFSVNTEKIQLSSNLYEVVRSSPPLLLAIPAAFIGPVLNEIGTVLQSKIILSAVKGIVPDTQLVVGQHLEYLKVPKNQIGVIGGPSHAEEVAREKRSYLTIAFPQKKLASLWANRLACEYIHTKVSKDVTGIEYAAMLKNIYALAAGIASGLEYGDNFNSVLLSNAVREMKRFLRGVYGKKRNINHSAYLGDLLVTAFSNYSRNRNFGVHIGKGYTVKETQAILKMVAEGYYAVESAVKINNGRAKIPIIESVYEILYKKGAPYAIFSELSQELR